MSVALALIPVAVVLAVVLAVRNHVQAMRPGRTMARWGSRSGCGPITRWLP